MRPELDPGRWQSAYDFPAVRDGRVVKEALPIGLPRGMSAFVFNTRRPLFADIRIREAISLLLDFDWINHNVFFGLYQRTGSFFEGSELAARGRPADDRERALLAPYPDAVRPDVMNGTWEPPHNDGSGRDRDTLRRALSLFAAAGYQLKNTELRHRISNQQLSFEILVTTREEERLALFFSRDLKRAGVNVRVRMVDAVQFDRRRLTYDFDMMQNRWDASLSPGNEQSFYWGSAAADADGTRNYMGMKNPAADAMIAALLRAESREDLVSAVRALDRVLISGIYVVPLFHLPDNWVARWAHIERPAVTSLSGYLPETWWQRPERPAAH
jgi:peptide/nickel transport system substrate-binding protein